MQAQQDQVWQRTLPTLLVAALVLPRAVVRVLRLTTLASTMFAPIVQVTARTGGVVIRVGNFDNPANAQKVATRLTSMGLPASVRHIVNVLQSV